MRQLARLGCWVRSHCWLVICCTDSHDSTAARPDRGEVDWPLTVRGRELASVQTSSSPMSLVALQDRHQHKEAGFTSTIYRHVAWYRPPACMPVPAWLADCAAWLTGSAAGDRPHRPSRVHRQQAASGTRLQVAVTRPSASYDSWEGELGGCWGRAHLRLCGSGALVCGRS